MTTEWRLQAIGRELRKRKKGPGELAQKPKKKKMGKKGLDENSYENNS